jgi:hypothetical protein
MMCHARYTNVRIASVARTIPSTWRIVRGRMYTTRSVVGEVAMEAA